MAPGITSVDVLWEGNQINLALAFQIQVNASGTDICLYENDIENSLNPGLNGANIQINNGQVTIARISAGSPPPGFALPTGSSAITLFTLHFRASPGTSNSVACSLAKVIDMSSVIHDMDLANPEPYTAPSTKYISGIIRKIGTPVECVEGLNNGISGVGLNIEVNAAECSPNSYIAYVADGNYQEDVTRGFEYLLTPMKDGPCLCGLDAPDFKAIQDFVLGTPLELHEMLAADMNMDNVVSSMDIALMLQCLNGTFVRPAGWAAWRFYPISAHATYNVQPITSSMLASVPRMLSVPMENSNVVLRDFYGVKRGDVDQSCTNCGDDYDATDRSKPIEPTRLFILNQSVNRNEEISIPLRVENLSKAVFLNFDLMIDNKKLEVIDATNGDYAGHIEWEKMELENGTRLHLMWFPLNYDGVDMASSDVIVYVRLRAKENIPSLSGLIRQDDDCRYRELFVDSRRQQKRIMFDILSDGGKLKYNDDFYVSIDGASQITAGTSPSLLVTLTQASEVAITTLGVDGLPYGSIVMTLGPGILYISEQTCPPISVESFPGISA